MELLLQYQLQFLGGSFLADPVGNFRKAEKIQTIYRLVVILKYREIMMLSNQSQKGGDNSNNMQVQQMVVHVGVDEKRAREIYQELTLQLRKDYSREALEIAHSRVDEFESRLMPKMVKIEGAMEAFGDPSFQLLLLEAQKTAAATERPVDYDLLSELLVHRFNKDGNRHARAGISLAVEIVDKISDEALLALTVANAVRTFGPITGEIDKGLDDLDALFGKVIYNDLPVETEWLDHLDILNAVRITNLGKMMTLAQVYSKMLSGFVDVGIAKDSDDHKKAIEILLKNGISCEFLMEHSLDRGFVRLGVSSPDKIDDLSLTYADPDGKAVSVVKITEEKSAALKEIYALYSKDASLMQKNLNSLERELDKRPNLKKLRAWWDGFSLAFNITSVGRVLAHSNAQRCDKNLPPFD